MQMKRRSVLAGGAALAALTVVRPGYAAGTGNIFVSTEKGNEVVVLDKTFNIIKRIATSKRPRDMQMTKAHDLLYVACGDDDTIDVIDVASL
jgi:DNA-binding beta-propeller fold protein YncE